MGQAKQPKSSDILRRMLREEGEFSEEAEAVATSLRATYRPMSRMRHGEPRQHEPFDNAQDGNETEQMRLFSQIITAQIGCLITGNEPGVEYFRRRLGHYPLTEAQAWECLSSSLWQILTFEHYQQHGLDPVETAGELLEESDRPGSYVPGEDGTLHYLVELRPLDQPPLQLKVQHDQGEYLTLAYRMTRGLTYVHRRAGARALRVEGRNKAEGHFRAGREISGYQNSITGEALSVSQEISEHFQWEASDALLWLLTGNLPTAGSLTAQILAINPPSYWALARITLGPVALHVQPWMHPDQLARFWSKRVLPKAQGQRAPYDLPSTADMELYQIVQSQALPGRKPSWAKVGRSDEFKEWMVRHNRQIAKDSWRSAIRNTYRYVEQALEAACPALIPEARLQAAEEKGWAASDTRDT